MHPLPKPQMSVCISSQLDLQVNSTNVFVPVNTVHVSEVPVTEAVYVTGAFDPFWGKGVANDAGRHKKETGENRWLPFAQCIFTETHTKF